MAKKDLTRAEAALIQSATEATSNEAVLEKYGELPAEWDPSVELIFEPFVDTWKLPQWCRSDEYAYGWLNRSDQDEMMRAFESGQWRLVKRVNHPVAGDQDFNMHGLCERMGQVLIFRPKWLDDKIRQIPVIKHIERTKQAEDKLTQGAIVDERGKTVAVFEPMQSNDSDIPMFVEDHTTGEMIQP